MLGETLKTMFINYLFISLIFCVYMETIWCVPVLLNNYSIWDFEQTDHTNDLNGSKEQHRFARVLNFFPVPVPEECPSSDGRRKGICMNTYECHIQGGVSHGKCALGFGVCCVFTISCGQRAIDNNTYFVNPKFPDLSSNELSNCTVEIKRMDSSISQIRMDFIHFNLGQPNRRTGVCDEDMLSFNIGTSKRMQLCGMNSGQHLYFDVEGPDETAVLDMRFAPKSISRLWEIRIMQIPFFQRVPSDCLQYHTGAEGIIQTMNFADNGRHLADQDYNICIRQEQDMCSIAYEPCYEDSFKISPNPTQNQETENDMTLLMAEGSGDELNSAFAGTNGGASRQFGAECNDKIVIPCENDHLMEDSELIMGSCEIVHCGNSLCAPDQSTCVIETNIKPFTIGVYFGATETEQPPEDNVGMCLLYKQQPCYL